MASESPLSAVPTQTNVVHHKGHENDGAKHTEDENIDLFIRASKQICQPVQQVNAEIKNLLNHVIFHGWGLSIDIYLVRYSQE